VGGLARPLGFTPPRALRQVVQTRAIIDAQKKLSALMTLAEQSSIGAFS
jgi:hypothetical protein